MHPRGTGSGLRDRRPAAALHHLRQRAAAHATASRTAHCCQRSSFSSQEHDAGARILTRAAVACTNQFVVRIRHTDRSLSFSTPVKSFIGMFVVYAEIHFCSHEVDCFSVCLLFQNYRIAVVCYVKLSVMKIVAMQAPNTQTSPDGSAQTSTSGNGSVRILPFPQALLRHACLLKRH